MNPIATQATFNIDNGKIKSNTHRKLEKELKDAISADKQKLSKSQADILQKAKQMPVQFNADKSEMDNIYQKLKYKQGTEIVEGKAMHFYQVTDESIKPSASQQKRLDELQNESMSLEQDYASLLKSNRYKQAKANFNKLKKRLKKAYDNLFKYEARRHVQSKKRRPHKSNDDDILAPHARIFETGGRDGFTLFLFAQSENESNSSDVTKYTIDRDEPVADHVRNSDKTLTISGYLRGPNSYPNAKHAELKSAEYYYQKLLKWRTGGKELSYQSNSSPFTQRYDIPHVYMKHLFIQSLNKDLQQATADTIKIDLTLSFAYKATVLSSKRNKNSKGKKSKNGKYAGAKFITVKSGATFYQLAKQYGTTVSQLKKWNGASLKSGEKVQVTQGHLASQPKRVTKSKIYQKKR